LVSWLVVSLTPASPEGDEQFILKYIDYPQGFHPYFASRMITPIRRLHTSLRQAGILNNLTSYFFQPSNLPTFIPKNLVK
jgi:hypothetical protein